jgi:ligand-binding sensor domain-containing protein
MARGRSRWWYVLVCSAAIFAVQRELPCRSLFRDSPFAPQADRRPLELPQPVRGFEPAVHPGARLRPTHHGSPHPARSALAVGDETWVATPSGVLRFDAALWRAPASARPVGHLAVRRGLPAVQINALAHVDGSPISVATDGGLALVTRQGAVRGVLLPGRRVTALAPGYAGTWSGLYRRRPPALVRGTEGIPVSALQRCGPHLYVGTHDRGLLLLRAAGDSAGPERLEAVRGIPPTRVGALAGCDGGHLWAATLDGLFRVSGDRATAQPYRRHVTTLLVRGHSIFFGTFGDGVLRLEPDGTTRALLPGERVSLLFAPPAGRSAGGAPRGSAKRPTAASAPQDLLVGTERELLVLRADGTRTALPLDGPPHGLVTALASLRGELWAGSFDGGLATLRDGRWEPRPIFDSRITALQPDARGRVWVGTAAGLAVARDGRVEAVRDPLGWLTRHISALRFNGARLWVAAHPGLVVIDTEDRPLSFRYLGASGKEADAGLVGPTVYGLAFSSSAIRGRGPSSRAEGGGAADLRREIWVGTDDGLSVIADDRTRSLTDLGGVLPDNWINDVRASDDAVYVLTLRSGLLRVDPAGTQIWRTRRFMTSPSVLLPVGGGLLFGTNAAGLVVAPAPSRRGPGALRTYGPVQGLSSSMVAALAYEPETDRLWIGGSGGIDRIERASVALQLSQKEARP